MVVTIIMQVTIRQAGKTRRRDFSPGAAVVVAASGAGHNGAQPEQPGVTP